MAATSAANGSPQGTGDTSARDRAFAGPRGVAPPLPRGVPPFRFFRAGLVSLVAAAMPAMPAAPSSKRLLEAT
eukprot:12757593-Alexandrium_andersonii.AAC.1